VKTRFRRLALVLMIAFAVAVPVSAADAPPYWAYPVNPPGTQPVADDGKPRQVPGSAATFTLSQIRDLFAAPDWHPDDHPKTPDIVSIGRKPGVYACGYCHLPNGLGRPENSSLAGLPVDYIIQQVAEFKSGARKSSEPADLPVNFMITVAKAATDAEVRSAAEYFATLKPKPWIKVIEAAMVPKTRIIEIPEDLERTELRDARSPFIAYVPPGSIERGKALVTNGGDESTACGTCHGDDLRGLGSIPGLAGRSPSYLFRQLYDMQQGVRGGAQSALMRPVVSQLTLDDMIAISAYAAAQAP